MTELLYNLGIRLYYLSILLVSPFNIKANKWIKGRKGVFTAIASAFEHNESSVAWFHCASLGEFEQARPLMEAFKIQYPDFKILLTFFSPSGYEIKKNYPLAHHVAYLPLDTKSNAKKMIAIAKPTIVFFTKYEFWHHYVSELQKAKVLLISFSAIFQSKHIYFKKYGGFFLTILKKFNHIFVQDLESYNLLHQYGINHASIAGDTRFDRVCEIANLFKEIPYINHFKSDSRLVVAGSTWPKDVEVILPHLLQEPNYKLIIAPHELTEENIQQIEKLSNGLAIRYSSVDNTTPSHLRVLIIDNIGMLSRLYKYGDIAYIGGGFGKGIHNTLEAAVYGMPILFGKNHTKSNEANEMIELGCAFCVNNSQEFIKTITDLSITKNGSRASGLAKYYVQSRVGASKKIVELCKIKIK